MHFDTLHVYHYLRDLCTFLTKKELICKEDLVNPAKFQHDISV